MKIVVKVRNVPTSFFTTSMSEDEFKEIMDYCQTSADSIQRQIDDNAREVEAGLPGRGDEWIYRCTDARKQYLEELRLFKTESIIKGEGVEYDTIFRTVAKRVLNDELYKQIADETQDRMVSA